MFREVFLYTALLRAWIFFKNDALSSRLEGESMISQTFCLPLSLASLNSSLSRGALFGFAILRMSAQNDVENA